jgi:hypothetical protein
MVICWGLSSELLQMAMALSTSLAVLCLVLCCRAFRAELLVVAIELSTCFAQGLKSLRGPVQANPRRHIASQAHKVGVHTQAGEQNKACISHGCG